MNQIKTSSYSKFWMGLFIFVGGFCLVLIFFGDKKKQSDTLVQPVAEIHCLNCGKNVTDVYSGRIMTSPGHYMCTLCYSKTMREIKDELRDEGYNVDK